MTDWLPPFAAAALLGVSVGAVHVLAHRRGWRKDGAGKGVRYSLDDVLAEAQRRERMGA